MRKRNVFITIFVLLVSALSFWACNPYKNYSMSVSETNIVLQITTNDDNTSNYESKEITVQLSGGNKSVNKSIELPISDFVTFEKTGELNGATTLKLTPKKVGTDDVVIHSSEGNLTQKIHVQVVKPVKDVSFTDSRNLAVEAGGTLDFSVNANNYIKFYPFDTTDKNLHFEVVEDGDKSGYAYFDGSVLHAKALSPDGSEIYPTVDGKRYITIKVISEDNPHLTATTTVDVANIVNTQTISMNQDVNAYSSDDIILTPNSAGEYEVILTPESLGGVSVSNEYASHRTIKIMMGESSVDHANYVVNQQLTNTPSTDPNKNKLGFEYDSSSNLFTFTLTGVTPGVVRKSVFIDHKDYIGKFTKEYKFVIKTINIPTVDSILLNNKALSDFTEENPLLIYNGYYSAGGMDTIPFALRDKNLDSSYGYTINFDYSQYMYSDNKIQLRTESDIDVINNNVLVSNGQTLYLKHNYESVNAQVAAFDVSYKYSLKPSNGSDEDYITYNVDFQIPFKLKMGVSAEEVDSLASNYYINSANSSTYNSSKVILALNELLVAEEQVERIEQNNDLVEFILEGNNIKVRAKNKSADGITLVTIYFANGRVSKQMVFTTYIPMLYQDDNSLLIEIQKDRVFSVGSLYINADDEIDWNDDGYNGVSVEEPNEGEYPYYTITDIILPTGLTDGMTFSVKNIFVDNGWQTKAVDKVVIADNIRTDYLKWDNGKLYTYDKATTNLGAEGYYAPVTLTLSYTGYTEGALITERVEHTVEHTINVWIFDEVTDLRLGVVPGTELYDANRVGAKLQEEESTLTPHVTPLPYREDSAAFGVTRSEFYIQSLEYVQGDRQDESLRFPKYYSGIEVTPEDIVRIEDGTLFVRMDEAKIAAIAHDVLHVSTADAYEDLYGNGIRCNLVGKITQFGIPKYTQSYVILKTATKVNDIIFNGVGNSGIYFEYRNGNMTNAFVNVEYNIYPVAATNKQINAYFEPLDPADAEGFVSNYEVKIEYTNYGGIITVKLKDGVDFSQELPQEYLVVVPYDSYVLDEEGEEALSEDSLIKRVLISYGNGTESAKFQIRSAADLERAIADTEHYYYVLANDINLQGYHIVNGSQFNGNLSGRFTYYKTELEQNQNGDQVVLKEVYDYYNFYGFNVNYTITQQTDYNIGLFGVISHNARVSDISINNAVINITVANTVLAQNYNLSVGILAGVSKGTIINSRVSGEVIVTVNGVMTNVNAGGMVGLLSDIEIDKEYMTPYIKGYYKEDNTETNTNVGVAIYAATSGNYNVGGLVGKSKTNNENKNIRNIENISIVSSLTITDKSSNVLPGSLGGIIGYSKNTNAYNVQVISSIKGHTVGGAFGTMIYGRINHIDIEFGYSSSLKNSFVATHTLGGLVGHAIDDGEGTQRSAQIQYSYVRSYTTHAIDNSYKGALILEEGGEYAGGIVGTNDCQLTIDSSYFDADLHVLGQGGTATTVSGGEATTNDSDGIANVGGFMGAHTKSTTIMYSYAKGRLVVEDGSFGLVSGSEQASDSSSTGSVTSVDYSMVGTLSSDYQQLLDEVLAGKLEFVITKTEVGVSYTDHYNVTLKNDTEINYSYVSFNENVFATSGGRVGIEKTTKFDYRTVVATKVITNIHITLVNTSDNYIYISLSPIITTTITTATGTDITQKTYNQNFAPLFNGDDMGYGAAAQILREYLYKNDTTGNIIDIVTYEQGDNGIVEIHTYKLKDGVTDYITNIVFFDIPITSVPNAVHARIESSEDIATDKLEAYKFGGYYTKPDGSFDYKTIEYSNTQEGLVELSTRTQADAQLLEILLKPLGNPTGVTTIDGAINRFKTFATDDMVYTGQVDKVNSHISFSDVFDTDNYEYFRNVAFSSNDITTGTISSFNGNGGSPDVVIKDTRDNIVAKATVGIDSFNLYYVNKDFKWMILDSINAGMPIIVEYVGDEDNNDSVLYRALYSSFPTIHGKVIDYQVVENNESYEFVQQYYKLTDESVVLLQGNNYSFSIVNNDKITTTDDSLKDVIEIDIHSASISSVQIQPISAPIDRYAYFVELLSKNELSYSSSNRQVLDVNENIITAVGTGSAVLTVSSMYDDGVKFEIIITVIPSFDSFKIKNLTTESSAYSSTVYVNEELALYAALMNGTSNVPSEYYGAILQFKDLDNTEEEGVILVNGLSKDYDLHYLESLDMLRVKGIELGRAEFMLTPFVYVTENTIGAESLIRADGTTAYIIVLENLTTTITTNIIQKAKSISIIGQNSVTINPDTTAVLDIVVESYTPDEALEQLLFNVKLNGNRIGQELMDATDFMALGVEGADGNFKYIIDNYYEYLGSTTTTDDDGVLVYNHKYRITINMSDDKYYRSIATNNNYQNPLSSDIVFDFTFAAGSNHNVTTDFKLTLKANELTKMDVNYYPIGELDANGSFNPNETKSSKVVPGKEGLIKVTPQRFYNALNYVEVIALDNVDDIRFTQVQFNNGNGLYEELRNPATTIANGIRLWNVSYQVNGLNYYDNTYYIKMHTSSALPQGNTLRVQVNAYALDGSLLYSHTETFITEYLPSVSAEILTDQGYYDTFAEVALHSVTPIKFESKYLEGPVLYYISNLRDTASTVDTNRIYLAKYVNDVLVRIPDNESVIINGEQYYLVVTDNYNVDEDNNVFLDITFMGSREMGGAIETTSTTIMVQVVYVKIDRVNLVGSYVDGANDLFLIRTGESSALQLALYSTNDTYEGGLLANQRTYLNAIADVFSGHLTLNGGYYNPYGVVKGDNIEPINDQTAPQFRYSHVENMEILNDKGETELYTYWEVQGTLISQVKLCATLDYYYDDNGYIQAYDGVSPKLAGRNYYTIRYYFILVIADGSTEDRPLPISNQLEFESMLDNNEGSFILKSDIVLENYKPKDINVNLLDGNSFRIILKSFSEDSFEQSSTLGLFKSVSSSTMIKNLTLDIGQFYPGDNGVHLLDLTSIAKTDPSTGELKPLDVTSLSFAFFAVTNSGCITNCAVVDTKGETNSRNEFLIKTNQKATGTTTYEAQVSGFVLTNSGSISNSYVGKAVNDKGLIEVGYTESNGEQSEHLTTVQTNAFDIYAGQKVAGFVLTNSGTISNSYAKGVGITNLSEKAYNSYSAGFVASNSGKVYNSFAEAENIINFRPDGLKSYGWQIQAVGSASGFVYTNSGDIQNAYSKLTIQVNSVNTGGFVYTNSGSIKNAYTTTINAAGIGAGSLAHGPFVGVAWSSTGAKQYGTLEHCYYLILDDEFGLGDDADKALEILETIDPAKPIMSNSFDGTGANFQTATPFEGFSITNNNDENTLSDYLWYVNTSATTPGECQGPTIVGATRKTISYRIHLGIKTQIDPVTGNEVEYNAYKWLGGYNFGSKRNPIIINTADGFVKSIIGNSKSYTYNGGRYVIFGSSNSAYNSVYAPSYVRIVNDIDLNEQALNTMYYVQGTNVRYKISDLIFMGQIDGNGMTVSGIKLTSTDQNMRENYGLFSQIGLSGAQKETVLTNGGKLGQHANQTPRLFNINFEYKEISNKNAQKVGLLAGSVYDATIRMISITGPDSEVTDKVSVISGWNLVGGAAGLISGANTNISDITLKNIRIIANKNTIDVDPDYINLSGYYDEFEQSQSGTGKVKATRIQLKDPDVSGVYEIANLSDISYAGSFAGAILANNYKTFAAGTETIVEGTSTGDQNPTINAINKTLLEIAETPEYLHLLTLGAEQNAVALRHVGSIHNITTTGIIDITSDNSSAMFGYIGNNTHISDAQVIIDTTQSGAYYHVYGHNFAGGIAAEMVGGVLERAEVRHDEAKQEDIDSKINKSTPAMISRLDFFKSSDSTKVNNSSIAVGGVAGFTESSILLDTYNKINVTNEDSRIAGGVVGYANKFNYLGFVYTTGDVLGREIMGGLVGLYTYNDYKLYLQEAFALNRWGSVIKNQSIFTKLQTNYYAIYGETYAQAQAGGRAHALTLPEIGNMYNGGKADQEYGDNLTGASSDKFSFIGSTIGKATLLPGKYTVADYTFVIGGANEGEVKGLLYTSTGQALTNATSTGSYIILPLYANAKYAKNLFINTDGETGDKISLPLYMKYDSANGYYIPDHYVGASKDATTGKDIIYVGENKIALPVPATTAGTEEINKYFNVLSSTYNPTDDKKSGTSSIYRIAQKVLDKSVYFNKFNYNVFSTTYGVLSESKVTASVYKMTYTGGNSFVLPNSNMGNIYQMTNVEKNGSANISDAIRDTLVGGSDADIIRYNSILGKQTYFEMITGYFFSNGTGDFNYNYYKFNNEFDTQYGFTKYMKENKKDNGDVSSYTPDGSGTWYKQGLNEVYFPEYSYGKHSSFIKISTPAELAEEFGDDTAGKFYSLVPEKENYTLTLSITTNRPQQFNNEFAGIIIGKVKVKDGISINPKIRINANDRKGVTTFLRSIENATFVNVDIEVYVKGLRDFASTDSYNGDLTSFGTIARYVENTIFNGCNFTVICDEPVNDNDYFKLTNSSLDDLTDFGFVFGETYGADFSDCSFTFKFCKKGLPENAVTDKVIKIQIGNEEAGATTGNYGVFIGKADGIGISNVKYSCPNVEYVVNNETPQALNQSNLNLGMVFGSVQNNAFIDGLYADKGVYNSEAKAFTVSGTARVKDNSFANVGVLAGSIISSTVKKTYTPVTTLTTNLTVTSYNSGNGHYLAVGGVAGFVQSGTITDVQATYDNKNLIQVTGGNATQLHLGSVFGLCDVSIVTNTDLQVVNTKLNVGSSCTFANTFVGGIMGSTGALGNKTGVPTQVDYEATVTTSISNYVYAGGINYKATSGTYNVGGIVGNAKQTNIINTINVANIDVTSASNYGTAGGLVAVMTLPRRSTNVAIQNNMTYGHLKFDMTSANTESRFGGFIGKMGTNSDRGTFSNNYSYTYMDYTIANSGDTYSLDHYDYTMYDIISTSALDLFKDVMYINEMMPVRTNTDAAKGKGYDYQNWHALSNVVPRSLTSASPIDTNKILEYILVGQGSNTGTIFNPFESLDSLTSAQKNKVYFITSMNSISSGTIAKDAMIIGQKLSSITGADLVDGTSVIMLSPSANTQIVNNGIISGFAFHLASDNTKTLFSYNNGVIYNTMVYGTLNSAISDNFASLVDANNGYVVNVNASTTYTGDSVNFNYSGLVYTNNGAIHRVVSTSGALSLSAYDKDKIYAPIAAVNTSKKITNALFGGVMAFKGVDNNSNITICSTSSTGSAGSNIKYEDLVASTSSFAYTATSKYAINHSYNFGMPYLKTAAMIPSRVKAVDSNYDLYTSDGDIVLVRSLTDIVKSNIEIIGWSSSNTISRLSIGSFNYIVCADITLSDYQGKYSDEQVIKFNKALNIEGNGHTFNGSGLAKTSALAGSLNIGKNDNNATDYLSFVKNYTISNFSVKGSGNIALIGKVTEFNDVTFENITVTATGKVSYMGAVLKVKSSNNLTATNITLQSASNNNDTTDGVGTIALASGNVQGSNIALVKVNENGNFTQLTNSGCLVGLIDGGNSNSDKFTLNNIIATSLINGYKNIGGLVGQTKTAQIINNSVKELTVTISSGKAKANIGGIVGYSNITQNVDNNTVDASRINFKFASGQSSSNKYMVGGVVGDAKGLSSNNKFRNSHMEISNLPEYKQDTQIHTYSKPAAQTNSRQTGATTATSWGGYKDTFKINYHNNHTTLDIISRPVPVVIYPINNIGIAYISGASNDGDRYNSTMRLSQDSLGSSNYSGVVMYTRVTTGIGVPASRRGMDQSWLFHDDDYNWWISDNYGIKFQYDGWYGGHDLLQRLRGYVGRNRTTLLDSSYYVLYIDDLAKGNYSDWNEDQFDWHEYAVYSWSSSSDGIWSYLLNNAGGSTYVNDNFCSGRMTLSYKGFWKA